MDGCCGPGYASPAEAIKAPKEKLLYTIAIYTGTGICLLYTSPSPRDRG